MIVGLKGEVKYIFNETVHLDVNGVIYEIFMPIRDSQHLILNEKAELKIAHIFREDSQQLYGFLKEDGKTFFLELINISGIGSKTAINILSHISEADLLMIIDNNDEQALTKVPKIGIKSARKLLNELSLIRDRLKISQANGNVGNSEKYIAIKALEGLGFSRDEVNKVVATINSQNHKDIIREALKYLNRLGN